MFLAILFLGMMVMPAICVAAADHTPLWATGWYSTAGRTNSAWCLVETT
ncbi:MAG: hypothetical protein ACOYNY_10090 [Caldilineaceae bacterium]